MSRSKIFVCFCLALISGIFIASIIGFSQQTLLGFLIFGIFLTAVFWRNRKIVLAGIVIMFFTFGAWHFQAVQNRIINHALTQYFNQNIELNGKIIKEPDIRKKNTKLTIAPKGLDVRILITVSHYPTYNYGDELKINGKLLEPQNFEDFNYQGFLAKDGVVAIMYQPKIEVVSSGQGNFIFSKILSFKAKLRQAINSFLSPPQSSLLSAMILGDKRQISDSFQEKLNNTGTRHISCLSGLHIVILIGLLSWLFPYFGASRNQVFWFSLVFLVFFIVMAGLPSSAVRAAIMAGLYLLSQRVGRLRSADRSLIIAGTVMLIHNPLLLRFDIGFQLSFLATLGIIYLVPIFQRALYRSKISFLFGVFSPAKDLLIIALSAQAFTLPLLIYNFGYVSLAAPFSNLAVVPVLPFIIGLGFVFALTGAIWPFLGWILSWPVWLLLSYVTAVIEWFHQLPFASVNLEISWITLVFSYLVIAAITWYLHKKTSYPSFLS